MRPPAGRLVGLDVARCLALLGMVATHLFDEPTPADGRASALFAVLAGASLALMTRTDRGPRTLGAIALRALLIAVLGLWLGGLGSGLAVILTYYGLLFLLGLPFVFLRARTLAILCGCWVLAAPALSLVVRPHLPERGFASPTFGQLADPVRLLSELAFTGYYPVVPWLAYLLAGLALGRANLRDPHLLGILTVGGLGVAVVTTQLSRALADPTLAAGHAGGMHGTTPADGDWSWLLLVAPHSATPFDLAQTIGSALFVIGACLLLERVLPRTALAIAFGAGAMTLTLYSLHVVLRTPEVWPPDGADSYLTHVAVLLAIGAAYAALGRRGPLETVVGWPRRWALAAKE